MDKVLIKDIYNYQKKYDKKCKIYMGKETLSKMKKINEMYVNKKFPINETEDGVVATFCGNPIYNTDFEYGYYLE